LHQRRVVLRKETEESTHSFETWTSARRFFQSSGVAVKGRLEDDCREERRDEREDEMRRRKKNGNKRRTNHRWPFIGADAASTRRVGGVRTFGCGQQAVGDGRTTER
jgi:hypothetical protein